MAWGPPRFVWSSRAQSESSSCCLTLALSGARRLPVAEGDVAARGLPRADFPSDHVPLVARFEWVA